MNMQEIRLTEYSHGAGCGCKISPAMLETILHGTLPDNQGRALLVGNQSRDDAAVYDIGNGLAVISTTDFFMPIVDDPFTFGRIAAANAISDIYAMGGKPVMAIAIFGWPADKLPAEVGKTVAEGGRSAARDAGITIAGGHSIDSPEPIFGLAVTGLVKIENLKRNDTGCAGDRIYLTKPLGTGILTTAQKQKKLKPEHEHLAPEIMCRLNDIGMALGNLTGVHAMTDVTGFGFLGHLLEVCAGSDLSAEIDFSRIPLLPKLNEYIGAGCIPGGTHRNYESYKDRIGPLPEQQRLILSDPQTSGGLLVFVSASGEQEFNAVARDHGMNVVAVGELVDAAGEISVNIV